MRTEKWRMVSKKDFLEEFLNYGKKRPYVRDSRKITKKTIDYMHYIWVNTSCVSAGCYRKRVKPSSPLQTEK